MDLALGASVYTQVLNPRGGIEADVTVTRTAPDCYMAITGHPSQIREQACIKDHADPDWRFEIFDATKIRSQGGGVLTMDVSVPGDPEVPTDYSNHDVAEACGSLNKTAIDSGNEHVAMNIMSAGACALAHHLSDAGEIDGVILLGGTMGTDLALDVCNALPLGLPNYVVSTVSFSALIPAERLPPNIQMILWAGGLYRLNAICRASLAQADADGYTIGSFVIDVPVVAPCVGVPDLTPNPFEPIGILLTYPFVIATLDSQPYDT